MNLLEYKPVKPFSQKHLLLLQKWSADEILQCLKLAAMLKAKRIAGEAYAPLAGKKLAMVFAKPSLRTRASFEVGFTELGGHAMVMTEAEMGLGKRESVHDIAKVLSRYVDGIMIRTFAQKTVEELATFGTVPVINGLTDDVHPCQALADLLTLYERKGTLKGLKLAFVGDGNNVANSLLTICTKLGVDVAIGHAEGYAPDRCFLNYAAENAKVSGSKVEIVTNPVAAVANADAVYADVFTSMGQEAETEKRLKAFAAYQINAELMQKAKPDALFLHCLPAHRGEEVTDEIMDGPQSAVFDQAENRLHAQKAVMALLIGGEGVGRLLL